MAGLPSQADQSGLDRESGASKDTTGSQETKVIIIDGEEEKVPVFKIDPVKFANLNRIVEFLVEDVCANHQSKMNHTSADYAVSIL